LVGNLKPINEELDTFLYCSSHDLRRPITTVLGLAEVAQLTLHEQEGFMLFDKVKDTAVSMNKMLRKLYMINDLHAGIEETESVNFPVLKQKIVDEFSEIIETDNIDFKFEFDENIQFGAPDRLIKNIIFNLVENAILFRKTNNASVQVNIEFKSKKGLFIIVEDNGVGILPDYQDKIFDMYMVANESSKGNGLGLYVVKRTLDVLNGTILVNSQINKGSTFEVFIPIMEQEFVKNKNLTSPKLH
jgi:signal transduction histidine kinase